jgi:hypothetical protein
MQDAGFSVSKYNGIWHANWWQRNGEFVTPRIAVAPVVPNGVKLELKPLVNETGFKPWQPRLVQHIVASMDVDPQNGSSALDACGTGVGKTFITLGVIRERKRRALIICPKVLTIKWLRACIKMGVDCIGSYGWEWMKTGKTPFGKWEQEYTEKGKAKKNARTKFAWSVPDDVDIVFDEVHRASGMKTQNAQLVVAAKNAKLPLHCLSATVADDPTKMRAPGYALGLHKDGNDFYDWMKRHGVREDSFMVGGRQVKVLKFKGTKQDLQRIHHSIFPLKGVRVRPEEIEDFPKTQIMAEPYDIDNAKEIREAYEEMNEKILDLMCEKDAGSRQASILVEILRARQKVELLKIPLILSLTRDSLDEGNSVIIAVNFKETLKQICEELKITSVIAGVSTGKYIIPKYNEHVRQDAVDDFQSNKVRVIAGIIAAMREGLDLHDEHGGHPRESLISPPESSFFLKQVLGRPHRAGGMSPSIQRILFAAETIEEEVCERLANKLDRLDLLMDGDLQEGIFPKGYSEMRKDEEED